MSEYDTEPRASDGGFMRRMSVLLNRAGFSNLLGQAFGGKRDYWEVFGYDRQLDSGKMWEMYHRGGIAKRIIHAYPDAVWARPPQLYIKDRPEWNAAWDKFVKQTKLWSMIKKADILAGLGRYSVILVGTQGSNLAAPVRKGAKITYLQPYSEQNVQISEWERNPSSPRFGQPLYYTVYPNKNRNTVNQPTQSTAPVASSFRVHHSRMWHFQHGALESPVYGIPRYAPIWNYLIDLIKVVGSSAESYWMTAYQGVHADVDPEMEMQEDDADELSDEIDEYQHGLRRFIRTRGVSIKSLGSKVADPRGAFDVVLTLISGTTGIPKRILLGSEAGQLASTQDRANWAERVEEERADHAIPNVIMPVLEWLLEYGALEGGDVDEDDIQILWPEAFRMSPLERSQQSAQIARTAANLKKALEPSTLTPGIPDEFDEEGNVTKQGTPDTIAEPLMTREEARRIIGLSDDQQLLLERPE